MGSGRDICLPRREFVKAGAGLAAILAAGKAPAYLVRSLIGARGNVYSKCPYDAKVEYLQGTGAQHIDTGLKGTSNTDIYVHIISASTYGNAIPLGAGKDGGYPRIMCFIYWTCSDFFSSNGSGGRAYVRTGTKVGGHYEYFGNKDTRYILLDNSLICQNNNAVTQDFTTSDNMWLFNSPSQTVTGTVKIVAVKIKENGVFVRDFFPVRFTNELGNQEGAMYDKVSGRLFRNQGTGVFSYGNDI